MAVLGAAGRMGTEACGALRADPRTELVAAVGRDWWAAPADAPRRSGHDLEAMSRAASPQVLVDFAPSAAVMEHARWCASHGVHLVVGSSGFSPEDMSELETTFESGRPRNEAGPSRPPANCVLAPNFAIGAVLASRLAAVAAPFAETIEILEIHHDAKTDAPSGTAVSTAREIADARARSGAGALGEDPTVSQVLPCARGAEADSGIRIHSARMRGAVAHQEVLLGMPGQMLTIRHDSYDRTSFMPGMLMAVRAVRDREGFTLGLGALLGF